MCGVRYTDIGEKIVRKKVQLAARCDRRIQHAHRSRRRVAWIDEDFPARLLLLTVHRLKGLSRHQDFASHLERGPEFRLLHPPSSPPYPNPPNPLSPGRSTFSLSPLAP